MKNKIIVLLLITSLAFAPSCKKTEPAKRDYSVFTNYVQPISRPAIDSVLAQQLFDAVADFHTQFFNQIETDYPGLNTQMAADWKIIIETTDTTTQKAMLQNFDLAYHDKVLLSWNNSGISLSNISARYQNVLGSIPFTLGEFGQVTVLGNSNFSFTEPNFLTDLSQPFTGSTVLSQTQYCGAISGNYVFNTANAADVRMTVAPNSGCVTVTKSGNTTILPDHAFKYLTTSFNMQHCEFHCLASDFGNPSYATASFSTHVELNGNNLLTRNEMSLGVLAPIGWYDEQVFKINSGAVIPICVNNDAGLDGGTYTIYTKTENSIGYSTGGFHPIALSYSLVQRGTTLVRTTE